MCVIDSKNSVPDAAFQVHLLSTIKKSVATIGIKYNWTYKMEFRIQKFQS